MESFTTHKGIAAPLNIKNVDTDQIIPKQFLKEISRAGFGKHLFFDWRFLENGQENPDFVLNQAGYRTGAYTSPHIHRFNERIKLSGVPVSDQLLMDAFA